MTSPTKLLSGDRIRLTALRSDDVPALAAWDQDTEFLRLYDARPARPRSQVELAEWLKDRRGDSNTFIFGIRHLNDERLIGTVELDGILWPHRVCGLGIAIGDRADWGQGYGYEAAQLALAFAFQELNLHRVTATVFDYNDRSISLVERLGFRREGAFREFLERDSVRHDMLLYGLLRPEWQPTQRGES
jgi:RimJ/RimL family protein N-acetyltransferase